MADLILQVFDTDDATVLFEVGTAKAHANPYLSRPTGLVASELDLLNGGARIGQVTVSVIDPQTGATKAQRWLTSRLGVPTGTTGEGHTQLNGHRALLKKAAGTVILDGSITRVKLNDSFAGFTLSIRDIRERPRKVAAFVSAARRENGPVSGGPIDSGKLIAAPTVLPRGRLEGYGKLPIHDSLPVGLQRTLGWTVPPTVPMRGVFNDGNLNPGIFGLRLFPTEWNNGSGDLDPGLVYTDAIAEAVTAVEPTKGAPEHNTFTKVRVLWRALGTTPWNEVRVDIASGTSTPWGLFTIKNATVAYQQIGEDGNLETVRDKLPAILEVFMGSEDPAAVFPTHGQEVEFLIPYVDEPTEAYPFTFEGPAGEFLAAMYDGEFSERPSGVRYDIAMVGVLTQPIHLRRRFA